MSDHSNATEKRRDYSRFDAMSTENLKEILRSDSFLSEEESDINAILYIMEVIAKREQTSGLPDTETAWKTFNEKYRPCSQDPASLYDWDDPGTAKTSANPNVNPTVDSSVNPRRQFRFLKIWSVALAAVVIVACIFGCMMIAQASGTDVFGAIARWTEETFRFGPLDSSGENIDELVETLAIVNEPGTLAVDLINESLDMPSLQDTLDFYGITEIKEPTSFLEDYTLNTICQTDPSNPDRIDFTAIYSCNSKPLSIAIRECSLDTSLYIEKDIDNPQIYEYNGTDCYLIQNALSCSVTWIIGNYECCISSSKYGDANFLLKMAQMMLY